ncbi:MAG: hypothetical protein Q8P86_01630 [bacterium]|nr:hypothetical protein [bacterium]
MKRKKTIILWHGGGELGNQLWNFASIYAYCLEHDRECLNYSFFQYGEFFNMPVGNKFIKTLFFSPFKSYRKRRNGLRVKIAKLIYKIIYLKPIEIMFSQKVVSSENLESKTYCLPPTQRPPELFRKEEDSDVVYMVGWLFRNPEGLRKFRKELLDVFAPKKEIMNRTEEILRPLRLKYNNIVGVHIRQGDYAFFKSGEYFIEQKRVREILDEYMRENNIDESNTLFVITSDGAVQSKFFNGLNVYISKEDAVTDLFLLAKTRTIIGSDSSFGAFASWYGNIPHIIFKKDKMDWQYYSDKNSYFENKYCTLVNY